jgi:hypothetical protein
VIPGQDVVEQGGLARTQEAGQDRERDGLLGVVVHGLGFPQVFAGR